MNSPLQRDYRVRTPEDAEQLRELIGDKNVEAVKKALVDRVKVWLFRNEAEILGCEDLTKQEKEECCLVLNTNVTYAGWYRAETASPFSVTKVGIGGEYHDMHGDVRNVCGAGSGHISH